jgi:hypothetical protein
MIPAPGRELPGYLAEPVGSRAQEG